MEQRRQERKSLSHETLYLERSAGERTYTLGTIVDSSEGGLGLKGGFRHIKGEELLFEAIDGLKEPKLTRVVWAVGPDDSDDFRCGLAFVDSKPSVMSR
jgi:hypothetical protein